MNDCVQLFFKIRRYISAYIQNKLGAIQFVYLEKTAQKRNNVVRAQIALVIYALIRYFARPSQIVGFSGAVGGAVGGLFTALSLCCMTRIKTLWLKIVVGIELGAIGGLLAFSTSYGVALLLV